MVFLIGVTFYAILSGDKVTLDVRLTEFTLFMSTLFVFYYSLVIVCKLLI